MFHFFTDFDGYYIIITDKGQPRPKYIFNKCGTNIYYFTLQRFGPSPSPNFLQTGKLDFLNVCSVCVLVSVMSDGDEVGERMNKIQP